MMSWILWVLLLKNCSVTKIPANIFLMKSNGSHIYDPHCVYLMGKICDAMRARIPFDVINLLDCNNYLIYNHYDACYIMIKYF